MDATDVSAASAHAGTARFQLLGPVRAWRGDDEIDLGSAHRRAVLAVLALSAGHTVSRDELIDALWGDEPPSSASGSIYTYVSGLRQALEPGRAKRSGGTVLASVGSGYSLHVDRAQVDVHRFTAARTSAANADPHDALRDLDAALSLWHGDALTGIPGPFAQAQRAKLAELRLSATENRAELVLGLGRPAELVAELTALCREHPLRERLRMLLMRALHGCGRTAEALDVFADARTALVEASGLEPGPELRQLQQRLLAGGDRPEPAVEPVWQLHRSGVHVGHKEELAVLRSAMTSVLAGRGGVLWLDGEPGIGKSALVAEALAGVPIPVKRLRWAAAQELDSDLPLRFIQDCLGITGDTARVVESVEALCADGPLIVVADDLQWADEASLSAWWRLARHTDRLPLLLLGCARPAPSTATHEKLRRYLTGRTLTLHPLSTMDSYRLAEKLTGAPPAGRLCDWLNDAAGNPYYVRKVVATVAGELLGGPGVPTTDDGSLPPQLVSWIDDHLSFLSAPARAMLRWGRLLGEEFTLSDLSAAAGQRPAELAEPLDEALTAGVLLAAGEKFRFRHPLVARALYEKTPNAIRVALHQQVAEALAEAGAPPVRVAAQLAASTLTGPLVSTWLPANIGAVAAEAPKIAVHLLRLAVTSAPSPEARQTLAAMLARLLFWLGWEPEAEARSLIARADDEDLVAELRWMLAYGYWRRGRLDDARHETDRVLLDGRAAGPWQARHALLRTALTEATEPGPPGLAEYRLLDEDTRAALEHAGSAVPATTWQLAVHRALPAELHMTNAMNQFWRGRWAAAQAELDIITEGERDPSTYVLRRPAVAVAVAGASALIAAHRADRSTARRRLRLAGNVAGAGDAPLAVLFAARATLAELAGDAHEALDEWAPLLDVEDLPLPWYRWLPDLARLAVRVGDRERAERLRRWVARRPVESLPVEARMMLAYCASVLAEDPDGVGEVVTFCDTTRGLDLMRADALADVAWLLARRGQPREAQDVLGDALASYRTIGAEAAARRAEAAVRFPTPPHALV